MNRAAAEESTELTKLAMLGLLGSVKEYGRTGSDVRRAIGSLLAELPELFVDDAAGEPIANCYELARRAGVSLTRFDIIRNTIDAETPVTFGGRLTKSSLIQFNLCQEAKVIADYEFKSRQDVDRIRDRTNAAFAKSEEAAADMEDSATYMAIVRLHAAVMFHLTETARPLPRMIRFRFAKPLPTLVVAYRLYDDANRSGELIAENKVVHPAFMRNEGLALSF